MVERGIDLARTTIMRWVQRYVPEFEKHWQRYARPVGTSWRVDETYIRSRLFIGLLALQVLDCVSSFTGNRV